MQPSTPQKNTKTAFVVTTAILTMSAIIGGGYLYTTNLNVSTSTYKIVDFGFYIYCPERIVEDTQYYRVQINSNVIDNTSIYFYCGLAALNKQSCKFAKQVICTSPGPRFDINRGQKINVQWINNLNTEPLQPVTYNPGSGFSGFLCDGYEPDKKPQNCYISGFIDPVNPKYSCSPTQILQNTYYNYSVSRFNIPITTHIHGLQVPGMFDGNPTSWWTKNGTRGLGFHFNSVNQQKTSNAKNNTYLNLQPPGMLWYHDHVMSLTHHNVNKGLVGLYIIRDPKIEALLPSGDFEVFLIFSQRTQNYTNLQAKYFIKNPQDPVHRFRHSPNPSFACILKSKDLRFSKSVYRIRMLNAFFKSIFTHIQFIIFDKDPNLHKNFTVMKDVLNFTVIGTDSSIMRNPQYNVQQISLSSAQRIDILIDFNQPCINIGDIVSLIAISNSSVRAPVFYVNTTIYPRPKQKDFSKESFYSYKSLKPPINIDTVIISNSKFDNLTNYSPSKYRFRTLGHGAFGVPNIQFVINSHPMYQSAQSEDPIIGSIQDWVIINTMVDINVPHPIHIHLINFQIIAEYNLLKLTQNYGPRNTSVCTLYSLDYYKISMLDPQACFKSYPKNLHAYSNNFSETSGDDIPNLFQNCTSAQKSCLYIESNKSNYLPRWSKAWKEITLVNAGTAKHLRIRWAKTDYQYKIDKYNYFSYPNESITAAPGYVYHCHFLDHEDSAMMRPIMVRQQNKIRDCDNSQKKMHGEGKDRGHGHRLLRDIQ